MEESSSGRGGKYKQVYVPKNTGGAEGGSSDKNSHNYGSHDQNNNGRGDRDNAPTYQVRGSGGSNQQQPQYRPVQGYGGMMPGGGYGQGAVQGMMMGGSMMMMNPNM